jgi:serine/threonine protein kinase
LDVKELADRLADIAGPDPLDQLGALKVFNIPDDDPQERSKVVGRLQTEMTALQKLTHPAVLRLLDGSHLAASDLFMVTEYHHKGTLHDNLRKGAGKVAAALEAFRPLVEAVDEIHKLGAIHRDIKPKNIFVNGGGHLVQSPLVNGFRSYKSTVLGMGSPRK